MGLIRLLILAAIIYLIWRFYQSLRAAPRRATTRSPPTTTLRMMKCPQCGVHVPEPDAFVHRGLGFCCQNHQRLYLDRHEP